MATTSTQQKQELFKTIWAIANELRGAVDGWDEIVREKGFFILPSQLFQNVVKVAKDDANLNETLSAIFAAIESSAIGTNSEADMRGLFEDLDVNSSKLGNSVQKRNEKLVRILQVIAEMQLGERAMESA